MSLLHRDEESADGIEVTWEDQQRINAFSRTNGRLGDVQGEVKRRKEEKEYLDDLEMELELADEDGTVLYRIGEAFFHLAPAAAMRRLKADRRRVEAELKRLEKRAGECEAEMKELKVVLYAKFGRQINLELSPAED